MEKTSQTLKEEETKGKKVKKMENINTKIKKNYFNKNSYDSNQKTIYIDQKVEDLLQ
jgi:hypothetical protein